MYLAGATSSVIIKRGRCMYHSAAELADLGAGGDGGTVLDAAARAFQRRALTEAPALMKHTAEAVQLETMRCSSDPAGWLALVKPDPAVYGLHLLQASSRHGRDLDMLRFPTSDR